MSRPSANTLPCQRALFDIPRDVCWLNAGSWSPLPRPVLDVGEAAVRRKAQPWTLSPSLEDEECEAARSAAAQLVGAKPSQIALIPSIGYGVASAAKALSLEADQRVIVLADDHTAPVLQWTSGPACQRQSVRTIPTPRDGDWTTALLAAIDEEGPKGLALVSASSVHWADGGAIDMGKVRAALSRWNAALLIDATHAVGVMDMDVKRLDPDFLLFPTYKWLLGPYGRAFLYVAERHQQSVPLEQTMSGRKRVRAEDPVYLTDLDYVPNARRFDMSERDFFISLPMATAGMKLVQGWGREAVESRLSTLTQTLADGIRSTGLPISLPDESVRSPHILCLKFPKGMPPTLHEALKLRGVFTAPRLGRLRLSPHVYNDEADCSRFIDALKAAMQEAKT